MANNRSLWYGFVDPSTIHRNGTNNFIRIRGDFDSASNQITNVSAVSGYFDINYVIPGQQLVASTYHPSGTIITAVDVGNSTITTADQPSGTATNALSRISPAETQYFVVSASLAAPNNNAIQNYQGVTGSEDTEYNANDRKWGVIGPQASTSSNSDTITGEFSLYEITRIYNRRTSNTQADFYISSSTGILEQKPDLTLVTTADRLTTIQLSETSSLPPIFDVTTIDNMPGGGSGFAGYPLAIPDIVDKVNTGSGGGFPFTGSANISGSMEIDGSTGERNDFFIVKNNTFTAFKVSSSNVTVFGDIQGARPVAVGGGMIYSASNFYAGID